MVVINTAYTEAINPSGASPVLKQDQIWRGLQRKIRKAQDFVPPISGTDVLEEKENEVTRVAHFKQMGDRPPHSEKEVCKSYYPSRVDFWQESGALISNTVSDGPGLTDEEKNMTYAFEWRHPEVEEGSDEHKNLVQQYRKQAQGAVHSSIEAMRKMAANGELD